MLPAKLVYLLVASICLALGGWSFRVKDNRGREEGRQKWFWDELPKTCGRHKLNVSPKRIFDGKFTFIGQFPSFVKLQMEGTEPLDDGRLEFCGGVIISQWHVMTAAHCVEHNHPITISTHTYHPEWGTGRYKMRKVCISEDYRNETSGKNTTEWPMVENDLAILLLESPIQFSKIVQPACLPTRPFDNRCPLQFIGLGATYDEGKKQATPPPPPPPPPPPRNSPQANDESCDEEEAGASRPRRKLLFPNRPLMLDLKPEPCTTKYNVPSISCFITVNENGTFCAGDSGSPAYATENGRQTVHFLASHKDASCKEGNYDYAATMSMTNVYEMRTQIKSLLGKCR